MEGWQIGLLIWTGIATIVAAIIRRNLGDRRTAWKDYKSAIFDYWDEYDMSSLLVAFISLVIGPGIGVVALWDWLTCPSLFWLCKQPVNKRRSRKFQQALAALSPFERECYDKIKELREHRRELQNELRHQENDNDPNTPTPDTLRRIKKQLKDLDETENGLWSQVSVLPMSDLLVHQRLSLANKSVTEAKLLLETANDPTVKELLRGNSTTTTPEEVEKARAELRQS